MCVPLSLIALFDAMCPFLLTMSVRDNPIVKYAVFLPRYSGSASECLVGGHLSSLKTLFRASIHSPHQI
jgi:hypothetical protein